MQTKVTEYLLFSFVFFAGMLIALSAAIGFFIPNYEFIANDILRKPGDNITINVVYFIGSISVSLANLLLTLYWTRIAWNKPPKKIIVLATGSFISLFFIYFPIALGKEFWVSMNFEDLKVLRMLVEEVLIIQVMIVYVNVYKESFEVVIKTARIERIHKLWRYAVSFAFLWGSMVTINAFYQISNYLDGKTISADPLELIRLGIGTFAFIICMVIAIFYPEGLLVFRYQISNLYALYDHIQETKGNAKSQESLNSIERYIASLPKEVIDDYRKQDLGVVIAEE